MPMVKMVNLHHFSLFVAAILLPPPQPTPMSGDLRFDNMPSGWSDSSTERFPGWDIIPTQVPNLRIDG